MKLTIEVTDENVEPTGWYKVVSLLDGVELCLSTTLDNRDSAVRLASLTLARVANREEK